MGPEVISGKCSKLSIRRCLVSI